MKTCSKKKDLEHVTCQICRVTPPKNECSVPNFHLRNDHSVLFHFLDRAESPYYAKKSTGIVSGFWFKLGAREGYWIIWIRTSGYKPCMKCIIMVWSMATFCNGGVAHSIPVSFAAACWWPPCSACCPTLERCRCVVDAAVLCNISLPFGVL